MNHRIRIYGVIVGSYLGISIGCYSINISPLIYIGTALIGFLILLIYELQLSKNINAPSKVPLTLTQSIPKERLLTELNMA